MNSKRNQGIAGSAPVAAQGPVSAKGLPWKEARALGKRLRDVCPRNSHAIWKAPKGRPDPVQLILKAEKGRLPELLPLRHGRMARSPFIKAQIPTIFHPASHPPGVIPKTLRDAFAQYRSPEGNAGFGGEN